MKRSQFIKGSGLFLLGLGLANCDSKPVSREELNSNSKELTIWWSQGFYPEETDQLVKIVAAWEEKSQVPVKLTLISNKDILHQFKVAMKQNNLPDVFFSNIASTDLIPILAWQDLLTDVSEVIEPLKNSYTEEALKSVYYLNKVANQLSYYALPIFQSSIYIHYWEDLLESINYSAKSIPNDWNGFWQFWERSQLSLRQKNNSNIYAYGLPMSLSWETFDIFEQFLEAYDVRLLDENGGALLKDGQVLKGVTAALEKYTSFYIKHEVPPKAINWTDPNNNINFLSRLSLMTVNPTLSIPGSQTYDREIYQNQLATINWPNKPSGESMRYITQIAQVIIPKTAKNQAIAKNFLSHLAQPENLEEYIRGSQGRFFPVMPELLKDPFWQNSDDPHTSIATKQFQKTRLPYVTYNPGYTEVRNQNIWSNAIKQIIIEGSPPQIVAREAIEQIEQILADWQ